MRLLLVEDDAMIGETIDSALRLEGHVVDWVRDGPAAELAAESCEFDLVILDLGLPRKDGSEVLRSLRARKNRTPVLIVTARDAVPDRIKNLDAGADDYLVKPFDLDELSARVRALARRSTGRAEPQVEHLGVTFDTTTREVIRNGAAVALSAREAAVLEALLARPGAVLSRAQLEQKLYPWGEEIGSNAIEVYIHGLRRKLGTDFIRTVRGLGYVVPKAR